MMGQNSIIGFCGMTHLGLNSLVVAADKGFRVIGFDEECSATKALSQGNTNVKEPGLEAMLGKNIGRITFTNDRRSLNECDLLYVAADVPTREGGESDLGVIEKYMELALGFKKKDAIVVVLSQVPPGFTRSYMRNNLALFYQVETLIFGQAIERAASPERYIVGSSNKHDPLPDVYKDFLKWHGNPPIVQMSYESAELAKISINCMLAATVSTANTLAELCEHLGADWSEIVPALRLDRRIGKYSYIESGLGLSGGNLERDLDTVIRLGAEYDSNTDVVHAWVNNSKRRKSWCHHIFTSCVPLLAKSPKISVLGLAYKPNTHSIKNSPALVFLEQIKEYDIKVFDPVVSADGISFVSGSADVAECISGCDVLVVMTPWPEFCELTVTRLQCEMRGNIIIDPYGCLRRFHLNEHQFQYFTLGSSFSAEGL